MMRVHLISGYAVDCGDVSFKAGNTDKALKAAKAIWMSTPNQDYGNSIRGNRIWKTRDLPKLTANDRYQADGRLTSNPIRAPKCWVPHRLGTPIAGSDTKQRQRADHHLDFNGHRWLVERRAWWTREAQAPIRSWRFDSPAGCPWR